MSSKVNPKIYMDIQIGAKGAGRIIFQLFADFTPKTVQNFRGLCTGDYQSSDRTKLTYQNCKFHRIDEGCAIHSGDITNGNGTGGYSIYGRVFNDQSFARKHSCAGLLSMTNFGRNTNSSMFFITLKTCPQFDDKNVVFGQVIDGMQVVKQIAKVAPDKKQKPRIPVIIVGCGQIGDFKNFLTSDPFQKSAQQKIRKKREQIIKDQHLMRKLVSEGIDPNQAYNYKRKLQKCEKDLNQLLKQQQLIEYQAQQRRNQGQHEQGQQQNQQNQQQQGLNNISDRIKQRLGTKNVDRLLQIRMKINEAKVQNSKAAIDQDIRQNDMHYAKILKRQQYKQKQQRFQKQLTAKGLDKNKLYLNRNSMKRQKQTKADQSFGWNVFGEDAYYKAYDRRCDKLQLDNQKYNQQMQNKQTALMTAGNPTQQALNNLVQDINKQQAKRHQFSRRRLYNQDQQVTYINQRNRLYNKKLDRSFGSYTSKIKTALQMNNKK